MPSSDWGDNLRTFESIASAWRLYSERTVDQEISQFEDMIGEGPDAVKSYRNVGLTALRAISEAMALTGRTTFADILDLPCGGGRVLRHLKAFFPHSRLHVADIDQNKLNSVVAQFGASIFTFPHDFEGKPSRQFDLIFSGSLLTHFDIKMFERALDFFVLALNHGGIAVLTLHGRGIASTTNNADTLRDLEKIEADFREHMRRENKKFKYKLSAREAIKKFRDDGFGYFMSPAWTSMYGQSYGGSYSSPSWIMRLVEHRPDCIVIGYKEKSYDNAQDVLILQKL
ncbi:class I SAM-dependent methyltransferase [Methylorubrum aminovorans]